METGVARSCLPWHIFTPFYILLSVRISKPKYGSKEFIESLGKQGLRTVWSHGGQPKRRKRF